jgi:hypothetical protein
MKILYGVPNYYKDVTEQAFSNFKYECMCLNNARYIKIPADVRRRDRAFGDPIYGTLKHVWINGKTHGPGTIYINLDLQEKLTGAIVIRRSVNPLLTDARFNNDVNAINALLDCIHSSLAINFGSVKDTLDFQRECVTKIKPDNQVILRNEGMTSVISLIIASLLKEDMQLVVYEKDKEIIKKLKIDRDFCEFTYEITDDDSKLLPFEDKKADYQLICPCNPC